MSFGLGWIETGQRKQHVALENQAFFAGEGDVDTEIRAAFGDQRLRTEQWVNRKFDPAFLFDVFSENNKDMLFSPLFTAATILASALPASQRNESHFENSL